MLWPRCYPLSPWAGVAILLSALAPAFAFDDREFCLAAQQIAMAADKDVGLWIDRMTRNAGMTVSCERKFVEFKRFVHLPECTHDFSDSHGGIVAETRG